MAGRYLAGRAGSRAQSFGNGIRGSRQQRPPRAALVYPACEVDLCGHATLASAHVLLNELDGFSSPLVFRARKAGKLGVERRDGRLWLDFPKRVATAMTRDTAEMSAALGEHPAAWLAASNNFLAVFASAAEVAALQPDTQALQQHTDATDRVGFIATAPADDNQHDFISRYFAPGHGVGEDPVTGSAHCMLAPYWAKRLGKTELAARQISTRGGELSCRAEGERVHIGGHAVTFASGTTYLPTEISE